jgi:hypothetical protein
MKKRPYLEVNRLADVISLIQILGLHAYRHRTERGLTQDAAQPNPRSARDWKEIAKEHPEFFRVDDSEKFGVSLISRHVLPKDRNDERELPPGFVQLLIQTALQLHTSQLQESRFWIQIVLPVVTAILGSVLSLTGVWLAAYLKK